MSTLSEPKTTDIEMHKTRVKFRIALGLAIDGIVAGDRNARENGLEMLRTIIDVAEPQSAIRSAVLPKDYVIAKWKSLPAIYVWFVGAIRTISQGKRSINLGRGFANTASNAGIDANTIAEYVGDRFSGGENAYLGLFFEMGFLPNRERIRRMKALGTEDVAQLFGGFENRYMAKQQQKEEEEEEETKAKDVETKQPQGVKEILAKLWENDESARPILYLASWLDRMLNERTPVDEFYVPLIDKKYARMLGIHLANSGVKQDRMFNSLVVSMAHSNASARAFREYRKRMRKRLVQTIALSLDAIDALGKAYSVAEPGAQTEMLDSVFAKVDAARERLVNLAASTKTEPEVPDYASLSVDVSDWTEAIRIVSKMTTSKKRDGKKHAHSYDIGVLPTDSETIPRATESFWFGRRTSLPSQRSLVSLSRRFESIPHVTTFPPFTYLLPDYDVEKASKTEEPPVAPAAGAVPTTIEEEEPKLPVELKREEDFYDMSDATLRKIELFEPKLDSTRKAYVPENESSLAPGTVEEIKKSTLEYLRRRMAVVHSRFYPRAESDRLDAKTLIKEIGAKVATLPQECVEYIKFQDTLKQVGLLKEGEEEEETTFLQDSVYGPMTMGLTYGGETMLEFSSLPSEAIEAIASTMEGDDAVGCDRRDCCERTERPFMFDDGASIPGSSQCRCVKPRGTPLPTCRICNEPITIGYPCTACNTAWFCCSWECSQQHLFHVCYPRSSEQQYP